MSVDWKSFYENYRVGPVANEGDLFVQVGKTIDKKPIPTEMFERIVGRIVDNLALTADDILLELCCGNGLITAPLSTVVKQVLAVDFTEHLIEQAKKYKHADNIDYACDDALVYLERLVKAGKISPTKLLMNDSLAYFDPSKLDKILGLVCTLVPWEFRFLVTGIPNDQLKWNFYNTPERVARYQENQAKPDNTNDGLGRWWHPDELKELAKLHGLQLTVQNQPAEISTYRMDAVFYRD